MLDFFLRLLALILLSRPVRKAMGLEPTRVFGHHYAGLLSAAKVRLTASGQVLPADVDDDDQVVMHWYTKDSFPDPNLDFRALNYLLRTGAHSNAFYLWILAVYLNEGLLKLPVRAGMSYRVIHNYPGFVATYQLASIVTEQSFLSSSRNPRNPFPGSVYFTLFGHSGRFIGGMSEFLTEDEILFPPQMQFKILEIDNLADGTIHVIMQEQ